MIALGHPEPFNHSPGHLNMTPPPLPPPPNHDHVFFVTKQAIATVSLLLLRGAAGPSSAQESDLDSDVPQLPVQIHDAVE